MRWILSLLYERLGGWLLLWGISIGALLASLALLGTSAWFMMAAAVTLQPLLLNIFIPSSLVRFFSFARILLRYVERWWGHHLLLDMQGKIRARIFMMVSGIPYAQLSRVSPADFSHLYLRYAMQMDTLILSSLLPFGVYSLVLLMTLILVAVYGSTLGALLWGAAFCGILILQWGLRDTHHTLWEASHQLRVRLQQTMHYHLEWSIYQRQSDVLALLEQEFLNVRHLELRIKWQQMGFQLLVGACGLVGVIGLVFTIWQQYQQQHIDAPFAIAWVLLAMALMDVLYTMTQAQQAAFKSLPITKDLSIHQMPVGERQRGGDSAPLLSSYEQKFASTSGRTEAPALFEIQDIEYQYSRVGWRVDTLGWKLRIRNVSIHHRDKILLTGGNGVGKSTLLHLLMGEFIAQQGELQYRQQPIQHYSSVQLYQEIGHLPSQPLLMAASLREQLHLADPQKHDHDLCKALDAVGIDWRDLPAGLDTWVGTLGWIPSLGQQFRLGLARLLLSPANIWLLDEPSAHLDAVSSSFFLDWLQRYASDKTIVCVSHRVFPNEKSFFTQHWQVSFQQDGHYECHPVWMLTESKF